MRGHLLLTIVAAVVLAPVGTLATSVLGLWATLVWFAASVGVLSGALVLRDRISGLRLIPRRVILTALVGCTVVVASSIGIVLGALELLDDEGSTASEVMNHTGLPPGAHHVPPRLPARPAGTNRAPSRCRFTPASMAEAQSRASRPAERPAGSPSRSVTTARTWSPARICA